MRRLKIFTAVLLAFSMLMAFTPLASAAEEATFESAYAIVLEVTDDEGAQKVLIKTTTGVEQEILLNINDETLIIDNETKESIDLSGLKKDEKIIAYFSKAMTRSIPPQSNCIAIVANLKSGVDHAKLMEVGKITAGSDGGIKFLNGAGDYIITVTAETPISNLIGVKGFEPEMIKEGDTVFVWFSIAALSYPAQATANALAIADGAVTKPEPPVPPVVDLTAKPTAATVLVNGEKVAFDAYTILDNNYFKLRDLAYVLSGTEKQFEVGYDAATKAITLTSGKEYTAVGGEMAAKGEGNKTATPTKSVIYLDGKEVAFTAYLIDGNNYFKLRDIGAAFDFGVDWDGASKTIAIDTTKVYTPE